LSSSTSSGSTPETPSSSSAVKPLPLHRVPDSPLQDSQAWVRAAALLPTEALSQLQTVLEQEASYHLLEAARCSEERNRLMHLGAYNLLRSLIDGSLLATYKLKAAQHLADLDEEPGLPIGGSDYMEADS
jgi:hypothetical protein